MEMMMMTMQWGYVDTDNKETRGQLLKIDTIPAIMQGARPQ